MTTISLLALLCVLGVSVTAAGAEADPGPQAARAAVDALNQQLSTRFSDPHGLLFDYTAADGTVALPTAEELKAAKPNGVAWWCPIENGAFFSGLWLAGLVGRWEATRDPLVAARARRTAAGLLLLASVGEHPAFIARGVGDDGRSHPPTGSDDQTLPWFYGLWRYLQSPLPTPEERTTLLAAMVRVGSALRDNGWLAPSDPATLGPRGGFAAFTPLTAPRLLFIVRALHDLTGERAWLDLYRQLRDEHAKPGSPSRLELCADGDMINEHAAPQWDFFMLWTKGHSVAALAALAAWEEDPALAARYRAGLARWTAFAAGRISKQKWSLAERPAFQADWRQLLPLWHEQRNVSETIAVAKAQAELWDRLSPRKSYELLNMAEPLFACWIVTLGGDTPEARACAPAIRAALCRYQWSELSYSTCFAGELAWWQGQAWLSK
ncbi:MAG: hypothetical protein JF592_18570 [Microbacterium sp.]|uniref:hypothetical protein n=1 Tax=Microbacterium sp. TaxID=51671 RepID=UPI001DC12B68|nr:hypothetical protein [Microbacterium sp.]MBW8764554.1 hypothetical protein [Microbacterium sp.]